MRRDGASELISVVLPLFNEAAVLRRLADEVRAALGSCGERFEIVFVNDGSTDNSAEVLDHLAAEDRRVRVVHFSRNFGHQAAVQAGLVHALGDAVVVMDSDLQDDPRAIPQFLAKWRQGWDVVYAVRVKRKEGRCKRFLFFAFYRLLNLATHGAIPNDAGNFSLLDRRVVDQVLRLGERDRFFPGLRQWVGFRQTGILVERGARHDDHPRVSLWGLFRLAKTALFSFSRAPLAMFYVIAIGLAIACCGCLGLAMFCAATVGAVPAWTWSVATGAFFGALNALGVAVLGEYVMRIDEQVRDRPSFVVARTRNDGEPRQNEEEQLLASVSQMSGELAWRGEKQSAWASPHLEDATR
jgi:dolichol-phosphate mannosyltransferase